MELLGRHLFEEQAIQRLLLTHLVQGRGEAGIYEMCDVPKVSIGNEASQLGYGAELQTPITITVWMTTESASLFS